MDIFTWFLQLNENASLLIQNPSNANDWLLIAYLVVSLLIKRSSYMAAFLFSCLLFEVKFFDGLSEYNLYLMTFAVYTFIFQICRTRFQKLCCGIILFLSVTFALDSYLYGIEWYYGATETIVYNNIERLALFAHILFISSLVPYRRIKNNIRCFIGSLLYMSHNSAYFLVL